MINIITGGGGFIGSHLCERLLGDGQRVICIDNFITGDRRNIEGFLAESDAANSSNFSLIEHDITEPLPINDLRGIIGDESEIRIYNLACPASPIDYQNIPLETLWVSAMGTKNMLELAAQIGARFLHTSTSEVYGDPLENPQKESYFGNVNCIGPRSCYDEGKRFAESLIVNYRNIKGVDTRIVRIFNTYGPKMRANDGRVMPNFINQALEGKDITVYGDGKQTRSFCYVDDMVDGIISLMNHDEFGGPVNIGNPN
ncbi:GDP-mannose 4,6-dehydratase, partial [Patescibacteria group bacterium]|nr:GDP-mannose 4,6-dehydratase [Patescibacteria group bacterium]